MLKRIEKIQVGVPFTCKCGQGRISMVTWSRTNNAYRVLCKCGTVTLVSPCGTYHIDGG